MRRALFRAGVVGVTTALALLVWGAIFSAVAWDAGIGSREETSMWTPLVVGPIIAVYIGVLLGLVWDAGGSGGGFRQPSSSPASWA
jgi:hypothetical protein